jgi:hypothetical protein
MPKRPARPGRWRVVLLGALGGAACALPPARWHVPAGAEGRFAESRRACRQLTSNVERFEDCMGRRGFERESLGRRMGRALTGD